MKTLNENLLLALNESEDRPRFSLTVNRPKTLFTCHRFEPVLFY